MAIADKRTLARIGNAIGAPGGVTSARCASSVLARCSGISTEEGRRRSLRAIHVRDEEFFDAFLKMTVFIVNPEGVLDSKERRVVQWLISKATDGRVLMDIDTLAILTKYTERNEDDAWAREVGRALAPLDLARDILRIATLIAYAFGGITERRRHVLDLLADGLELDGAAVDEAVRAAEVQLQAGPD